jgi:glycosyltransferase involved in cell wall biosynthesis
VEDPVHVLFVHKEFPGHFGHIARHLARQGHECTFVFSRLPTRYQNRLPPGSADGVRLIPYQTRGASPDTHYCSLHFEIGMWHSHAVYQTLKARPEVRPDLVVGHSGYGTALFLADLYGRPIINHCEYYQQPRDSLLDFRPEFPPGEMDLLRARAQNATNLLSLQNCQAGYSPMDWQRALFPAEYQPKIAVIFDGIERDFWYRRTVPRRIAGHAIPASTRIVTYVAYGLEPARGFDIFMQMAKRICDARRDVVFIVVGADQNYYSPGGRYGQGQSFRDYVLSQDRYDLSRFLFTGQVLEAQLVEILSLSDLHVYLTGPFVLSWSLLDALACGCTVLASNTAPVREVIEHERNGLLAGFRDVDGLAQLALRVLADPEQFRPLGQAGIRLIDEKYSMAQTIPALLDLFQRVIRGESPVPAP